MNQIEKTEAPTAHADLRVAILSANWHREIVHRCRDSASTRLRDAGLQQRNISHHALPGAFEIPLRAKQLISRGQCDAVIACAFVVDGGIYRHDFVANAVIQGLMQTQLETGVPIFSAVLTPHHFHAGETHDAFFKAHFEMKGREVAEAVLATCFS